MGAAIALSSVERFYEQGRQCFEHIVDFLDFGEACSMTHSNLERELEKRGRELMRILLQEHLDSRGPCRCEQPVCGAEGIERPRVRLQDRKLESEFGTVATSRAGYGQEGAKSLHPLDAELNLPVERYSLELHRRVAEEAAKNSFDETRETIAKTTGGHVPKPIATGVIEGAYWHLVKDRMEVTGAKWRLEGAEVVLRLPALRASHDFGEYWEFHEACEYKRNHQDLYAGGVVPLTTTSRQSSKRDHLKVIK